MPSYPKNNKPISPCIGFPQSFCNTVANPIRFICSSDVTNGEKIHFAFVPKECKHILVCIDTLSNK